MRTMHIILLVTILAGAGLAYQKYDKSMRRQETPKIDSIAQNLQVALHSLDSVKAQLALLQDEMTHLPIQGLQEKYQQLKKSVLLIVGANAEGYSQGTAFLIGAGGAAMTNYHVVEGMERFIVIDFEGNKYEIASFDAGNRQDDWQMFTIQDIHLPALEVATALPVVGDHCFTIGNPHGLKHTLSTGIVSGFRENEQMIQISAEIASGSSGGPLFNTDGQVFGITTGTLGEGNLNFAINLLSLGEESPEEDAEIAEDAEIPSSQYMPSSEENRLLEQAETFYKHILSHSWDEATRQLAPTMETFQQEADMPRSEVIALLQQRYGIVDAGKIRLLTEFNLVFPTCDSRSLVSGCIAYDDTSLAEPGRTRNISFQFCIDDAGLIVGLREREVMRESTELQE